MTGIIVLAVVVLLALWAISIYNNLVKLRNNRENAFANIDVQLKQRYDLVPQLVGTGSIPARNRSAGGRNECNYD